jgi:hypothetical protein
VKKCEACTEQQPKYPRCYTHVKADQQPKYPRCYTHIKADCSLWYRMGTLIVLRYGEDTVSYGDANSITIWGVYHSLCTEQQPKYPSCYTHVKADCSLWYRMGSIPQPARSRSSLSQPTSAPQLVVAAPLPVVV